jgi:hypothetical protein
VTPTRRPGGLAGRSGMDTGLVGLAVGVGSGLIVLAPLLRDPGRGFTLLYDMVFVPNPPITALSLGIDGSVPRAVPTDFVVAVLAKVIPAAAVQQLALLAIFALGGWGVARLSPPRWWAQAAAAVFFCWNAYVYERLAIGHWSFLLGYALLPWICAAAVRARTGSMAALVLWLGFAAACGSTTAVLGAALGLVMVRPISFGRARMAILTASVIGLSLPWLLPSLARASDIPADSRGVRAFATHADGPLGAVGSALSLGGLWNKVTWPSERGTWVGALAALAVVVIVVGLGARPLWSDSALRPLGYLAGAGFVLAVLSALPLGVDVVRMLVVDIPGGGLIRDSQKFLALPALWLALCAGHAVDRVASHAEFQAPALLLAVLPILVLPDLAFGVGGRLSPVRYPADLISLQRTLDYAPAGDVAVLPWLQYRRFGWDGNRILLDPLPRLLDRRVIVDDDLPLSSGTINGEDPRAARIGVALAAGQDAGMVLRSAGVRYVVVLTDQPGASTAELGNDVMLHKGNVELFQLDSDRPDRNQTWRGLGFPVAGLVLLGAATAAFSRRWRARF